MAGDNLYDSRIVLLDRDGVINRKAAEGDYIKDWSEFEFLPGAIEALKLLTKRGYDIYVITNQRGVARGLISEADLRTIHRKMTETLAQNGAIIKDIYYCPHGEDAACACRKPRPGMLFKAASDYEFDLTKAVFVGDDKRDAEAGAAAGCPVIMVNSCKSLLDIAKYLVKG